MTKARCSSRENGVSSPHGATREAGLLLAAGATPLFRSHRAGCRFSAHSELRQRAASPPDKERQARIVALPAAWLHCSPDNYNLQAETEAGEPFELSRLYLTLWSIPDALF